MADMGLGRPRILSQKGMRGCSQRRRPGSWESRRRKVKATESQGDEARIKDEVGIKDEVKKAHTVDMDDGRIGRHE